MHFNFGLTHTTIWVIKSMHSNHTHPERQSKKPFIKTVYFIEESPIVAWEMQCFSSLCKFYIQWTWWSEKNCQVLESLKTVSKWYHRLLPVAQHLTFWNSRNLEELQALELKTKTKTKTKWSFWIDLRTQYIIIKKF